LDDSLFVSDGTIEDGGAVGLKVSDKFQKKIHKMDPVANVNNHLVYYNHSNWKDLNMNALAPIEAEYDIPKGILENQVKMVNVVQKETKENVG
jgi:hypothetical protein